MLATAGLQKFNALASAFLAAAALSACGGGGGGDSDDRTCSDFRYQEDAQEALRGGATRLDGDNDGFACESLPSRPSTPTPTPTVAQGLYSGTVTGSSVSTHFQLLALENGDVWSLYGAPSGATFRVRGFIQGPTTRSGSNVSSSSIRDFGFNPAAAATLTGTATTAAVSGTVTANGAAVSFSGTRAVATTYNYDTPAIIAQITGNWTLGALDGTTANVSIAVNGSFTGTNAGCSISGTIVPRPSGKNVFNVTVVSGPAPCVQPGTTATGIAVTYLLPNSTTRELIVAGVNAGRTSGNAFFGVR